MLRGAGLGNPIRLKNKLPLLPSTLRKGTSATILWIPNPGADRPFNLPK